VQQKKEKYQYNRVCNCNLVIPCFLCQSNVRIVPRYYRVSGKKNNIKWVKNALSVRGLNGEKDGGRFGYSPVFDSMSSDMSWCILRYVRKDDNTSMVHQPKVIMEIHTRIDDKYGGHTPPFDEVFDHPFRRKTSLTDIRTELKDYGMSKIDILQDTVMSLKDVTDEQSSLMVDFHLSDINKIVEFNRQVAQVSKNTTYTEQNIRSRYKPPNSGKINSRILLAEDIHLMPISNTTNELVVVGRANDTIKKHMPIKISVDKDSRRIVMRTMEKGLLQQEKYKCDVRTDCESCELKYCLKYGILCSWSVQRYKRWRGNLISVATFEPSMFISETTKLAYFSDACDYLEEVTT